MSLISSKTPFDLSLNLTKTHALITGGCGLIGTSVTHAFLAAGSNVTVIDLVPPQLCPFDQNDSRFLYIQADITDGKAMDAAFSAAEAKFGTVETCVALASLDLSILPQTESLADADPDVWRRVLNVNVHGTFLTARRWLRGIRTAVEAEGRKDLRNVNFVIVGSCAGRFGERTCAAYAAGKAAVQYGLLDSLAQDAPRIHDRIRVNAVAPGMVDTPRLKDERARFGEEWYWQTCEATMSNPRPVPPEDVARTILVLASDNFSGSVHGQLIPIDNGMSGILLWSKQDLAARKK